MPAGHAASSTVVLFFASKCKNTEQDKGKGDLPKYHTDNSKKSLDTQQQVTYVRFKSRSYLSFGYSRLVLDMASGHSIGGQEVWDVIAR